MSTAGLSVGTGLLLLRLICSAVTDYMLPLHSLAGLAHLSVSLGHTGRRRAVLGHTLNTFQHVSQEKSHALSAFTILCWAAFTPRGWTHHKSVGKKPVLVLLRDCS